MEPGTTSYTLADTTNSSNLYIKNLPSSITELELRQVFGAYGQIESVKVNNNNGNGQGSQRTYAFVKFADKGSALSALSQLNGSGILGAGRLEIKFADMPFTGSHTPSDNLYVRNIPSLWGDAELLQLFTPFGPVHECRVLHTGDGLKGAGALVRMATVEAATAAINGINGRTPQGSSLPLLVRFADSPEEKARKQQRKNAATARQIGYGPGMNMGGAPPGGLPIGFEEFSANSLADAACLNLKQQSNGYIDTGLQQQLNGLGLQGAGHMHSISSSSYGSLPQNLFDQHTFEQQPDAGSNPFANLGAPRPQSYSAFSGLPPLTTPAAKAPMDLGSLGSGLDVSFSGRGNSFGSSLSLPLRPTQDRVSTSSSLYVKNLPPDADELYLYKRFAPHGGILSVKVLQDETTGLCRGVGFVNYIDQQGAATAIQAVNGLKAGDKFLHVSLQSHRS